MLWQLSYPDRSGIKCSSKIQIRSSNQDNPTIPQTVCLEFLYPGLCATFVYNLCFISPGLLHDFIGSPCATSQGPGEICLFGQGKSTKVLWDQLRWGGIDGHGRLRWYKKRALWMLLGGFAFQISTVFFSFPWSCKSQLQQNRPARPPTVSCVVIWKVGSQVGIQYLAWNRADGLGVKEFFFVYMPICVLASYVCQCTSMFIRLYFQYIYILKFTCPRPRTPSCFCSKTLILKLSLLLCHCHQVMKIDSDRFSLHMSRPNLIFLKAQTIFSCI